VLNFLIQNNFHFTSSYLLFIVAQRHQESDRMRIKY